MAPKFMLENNLGLAIYGSHWCNQFILVFSSLNTPLECSQVSTHHLDPFYGSHWCNTCNLFLRSQQPTQMFQETDYWFLWYSTGLIALKFFLIRKKIGLLSFRAHWGNTLTLYKSCYIYLLWLSVSDKPFDVGWKYKENINFIKHYQRKKYDTISNQKKTQIEMFSSLYHSLKAL